MPDARQHRGPDPKDDDAFSSGALPALRGAVAHLCWLLSHGYATTSALKLVGDRWSLTERQRMAVRRAACGDEARERRLHAHVPPDALRDRMLLIDGFNLITTVETALGGGVVLACIDGCYRDLAGVHGTYRRVQETIPSLALIGAVMAALKVSHAHWLLDRPVSNSGRLKTMLHAVADEHRWNWSAELVLNPDSLLAQSPEIVATADSVILDRCTRWFGLARKVIEEHVRRAHVIHLDVTDG